MLPAAKRRSAVAQYIPVVHVPILGYSSTLCSLVHLSFVVPYLMQMHVFVSLGVLARRRGRLDVDLQN